MGWKSSRKHFYFYVTNVFVVTGDRRECLRTFVRPHRLEKPPKFALYFSYSIIIGIPIQTGVCCQSSFGQFRGAVGGSQEKLSPSKSTWSWKLCSKTMRVTARVIIPCKNGGRIYNSGVTSLFARELFLTRFCNKP